MPGPLQRRRKLNALGPPLLAILALTLLGAKADNPSTEKQDAKKQIIGATAELIEPTTGFVYPTRVDTGAKTCSLHVEKWEIDDEQEKMKKNIGKQIRFLLKDPGSDEAQWTEAKVVGYAIYKTSEQQERRYKVRMKLRWNDLEKEVLVNLNDRSHMEYPLLLGRNYLRGDLLVDVDQDNDD